MSANTNIRNPGRAVAAALVFLAMLLPAFSLWTAIPLSWVYIASKASHSQFPSGGPYAVVAVGIVSSVLIVAWVTGPLHILYIRLPRTSPHAARPGPAHLAEEVAGRRGPAGWDRVGGGGADGLGVARRSRPHH